VSGAGHDVQAVSGGQPLRFALRYAREIPTLSWSVSQAPGISPWGMLPPGSATPWWRSSPQWEHRLLGVVAGPPLSAAAEGELEHLRQVQGAAVGAVGDLLLAAEPVGDDQRVLGGRAHRG
jgi:hypothetical protein